MVVSLWSSSQPACHCQWWCSQDEIGHPAAHAEQSQSHNFMSCYQTVADCLSLLSFVDGLLGLYHAWQGSKATAEDLKLANARHSRHMFILKAESSTTWYACLCIRSPSVEHIPGCGDTVCAEQPWQCHHQSRLSLQVRQAHCPLQWPSCGTEQPGRGLTTPASAKITKVSQQSLVL